MPRDLAGPKGPALGRVLLDPAIGSLERIEQLCERPDLRSEIRIFCRSSNQSRPDRMFQDVPRNLFYVLVLSKDAIVITLLPKPSAAAKRVCCAGALLRHLREASDIRTLGRAFDEKMGVIVHQAVRKNQEVFVRRGTQELRDCFACRNRVSEHGLSRSRTKCQEIAVKSDVFEAVETRWARHEK